MDEIIIKYANGETEKYYGKVMGHHYYGKKEELNISFKNDEQHYSVSVVIRNMRDDEIKEYD